MLQVPLSPKSKTLLCFAHRGEAKSFFTLENFHKREFPIGELWESDQHFLAITGEGETTALLMTSAVLGQLHSQIKRVANFGVALGIGNGIQLFDVLHVRHIFGCKDERKHHDNFTHSFHFHSFGTINPTAKWDLISVSQRIAAPEAALQLKPVAGLVDREAWAVAFAAYRFHKEILCIKSVSDLAQNHLGQCEFVRASAGNHSKNLLIQYQEFCKNENSRTNNLTLDPTPSLWDQAKKFLVDSNFHFTFSMRSEAEGLILKLQRRGSPSIESICATLDAIQNLELQPKQRAHAVLEYLRTLVNPLRSKDREQQPPHEGQYDSIDPR